MVIPLKQIELPDPLAQALQRRAAASNVSFEEQIARDLVNNAEIDLGALTEEELLELIRLDRE